MPREALLVGNNIGYSGTTRTVTPSLLRRTVNRFAALLADFPPGYAFNVTKLIDARPSDVRTKVESLASKAARTRDLFLFYYFGHGVVSQEQELLFVHPPFDRQPYSTLRLSVVEYALKLTDLTKSLFIIDCCYAGAVNKTFQTSLRGEHCRIASTTPSARAYVAANALEEPIGVFTRSVLDGFESTKGCVSAMDNHVTADSLFLYACDRTIHETGGIQNPTMLGSLPEPLTEYRPTPDIILGVSESADEKTAYYKLLSICLTLNALGLQPDIETLYRAVLARYGSAFQTLYKTPEDRFVYRPVQRAVVARYVRLLRGLRLIDQDELKLSPSGRRLVASWRASFNQRLLESIDTYLKEIGLPRGDIENALRQILASRGVPSRSEVLDYLALGHRVPRNEIGVILDLLGHIRAIRMSPSRAYFAW